MEVVQLVSGKPPQRRARYAIRDSLQAPQRAVGAVETGRLQGARAGIGRWWQHRFCAGPGADGTVLGGLLAA